MQKWATYFTLRCLQFEHVKRYAFPSRDLFLMDAVDIDLPVAGMIDAFTRSKRELDSGVLESWRCTAVPKGRNHGPNAVVSFMLTPIGWTIV